MPKNSLIGAAIFLLCLLAASGQESSGQEYSIEKIEAAAEADGVSDQIAKLIDDQGIRVKRGSSRTVCEIWLCKELAIDAEFKPTPERLYPFTTGQLIGLMHLSRRGSEFRDQTVSSGWYTLRFGLQPVDGNHEGTSPTRDFLLLVDAEKDDLPENWKAEDLNKASAEAAGASHPALFCLQRPSDAPSPRFGMTRRTIGGCFIFLATELRSRNHRAFPSIW